MICDSFLYIPKPIIVPYTLALKKLFHVESRKKGVRLQMVVFNLG
jgi:hypothetical protein